MRKAIIILLALTALLMVSILFGPALGVFSTTTSVANSTAAAGEPQRTAAHGESHAETDQQRSAVEIPDPDIVQPRTRSASFYKALGKLRGRVVGSDGLPRSKATVDFIALPFLHREDTDHGLPWDKWELHSTQTGPDGTFEFQDIWLDLQGRLTILTADQEQYIDPRLRLELYKVHEGSICDLGDILLAAHASVSGRLLTSSGVPLSGVPIQVHAALIENEVLGLLYDKSHFDGGAPHTYIDDAHIRLASGLERAFWAPFPQLPQTDSRGSFSFPLPLGTWLVTFEASPPLLAWARAVTVTSDGVQLGEVIVPAGRLVTGVVVDQDAIPIPGAELLAVPGKGFAKRGLCLPPSDAKGRFQVRCAKTQSLTFGARTRGGTWQFFKLPPDQDHLVIRLDTGFHLDVSVIDTDGNPQDADLQLAACGDFGGEGFYGVPWGSDGLIDLKPRSLHLGPGRTRITGLRADHFLLSATKNGRLAASAEFDLDANHQVELRLAERQWLTVEVVNPKGQAVADARLGFSTRMGSKRRWTDHEGRVSIPTTDFEQVGLYIMHPGFAPVDITADLPCADLRVTLQPWCTISGRITSASPHHRKWTLTFKGTRAPSVDASQISDDDWESETDTAADWSFALRCPPLREGSITSVSDGSQELKFSVNGLTKHKFSIDNGTNLDLAVHADWHPIRILGTAHGTVSVNGRSNGNSATKLHVTCTQAVSGESQSIDTKNGAFAFDLSEPKFTITIDAANLFGGIQLFQHEYQLSKKAISIDLLAGTLKVHVDDQAGQAVAGGNILLWSVLDRELTGFSMTDESGNASWQVVQAGRYRLIASTEKTIAVSRPFEFVAGQSMEIDLRTKRGVSFRGRVEIPGVDIDKDSVAKLWLRDLPTSQCYWHKDGTFNLDNVTSGQHLAIVTFQPRATESDKSPKQVMLKQSVHIPAGGLDDQLLIFRK